MVLVIITGRERLNESEWWLWFNEWKADCRRLLKLALDTLDIAEARLTQQ